MSCPHPYGLKVPSPDGDCYACLKQRATNGSRSKLSVDQLLFVGFVPEVVIVGDDQQGSDAWVPAGPLEYIDKQLEELARLRDIAPGWYALARRIVGSESENEN